MNWFYIALFVPFFYAILNLFDANMLEFVYEGPYMATVSAGVFGSLPLLSLVLLRAGHISTTLAAESALAGFLTTCYFFFYFKALELEQPSVVIALFSLVPATLPFLAHVLLHEALTGLEIVGFAVVIIASATLAATDIRKFKFSAALVPMLVAVVLVDVLSLISKHVYEHAAFYPAYMSFCVGVGIGGFYFLFIMMFTNTTQKFKKLRGGLTRLIPILLLAEAVNLAAEFSLNLAISRGPLSVVKVIEGAQPVFVLLIAIGLYPFAPKYFREAEEGKLAWKFSLMVAIVIGLVLINLAVKA